MGGGNPSVSMGRYYLLNQPCTLPLLSHLHVLLPSSLTHSHATKSARRKGDWEAVLAMLCGHLELTSPFLVQPLLQKGAGMEGASVTYSRSGGSFAHLTNGQLMQWIHSLLSRWSDELLLPPWIKPPAIGQEPTVPQAMGLFPEKSAIASKTDWLLSPWAAFFMNEQHLSLAWIELQFIGPYPSYLHFQAPAQDLHRSNNSTVKKQKCLFHIGSILDLFVDEARYKLCVWGCVLF